MLALQADDKPSLEKRAVCLGRLGRHEEARELVRALTDTYPRDPEVWALSGRVEKAHWISRWRDPKLGPEPMREAACAELFEVDSTIDVVLMVGVGAANAGELVINGRGVAFVCLEHFTSIANPATRGLGLDPELIPMWLAHEIAHCVRYTSPASRAELRRVIGSANNFYSYWETGRHASLREHLLNEGLAVQASKLLSPGHAPWEYYGFQRRQYARIRELESVLTRVVTDDLDRAGLGLRLRWLSGGMSDEARTVQRHVLPERSGYWLGARMVEDAIAEKGIAWALRADANELMHHADAAARTA